MYRHVILTITILLTALFTPLAAQPATYEGRVIEEVQVVPVALPTGASFDSHAIRSRMKTQPGEEFSQKDFDEDLKLLSRDFHRVEPSIERTGERLVVTLSVSLKPVIRAINWEGNDRVNAGNLRRELGIKPGDTYDRAAFTKAFNDVKGFYVKRGFFEAELDYSVRNDSVTNTVDIDVSINEGRSGRVQGIEFEGLSREDEKAVLAMVTTKKYNLFISWATGTGTYREEQVQQDGLIILDYLQNQGYADAVVDVDVIDSTTKNRIIIKVTADKGDKYKLGDITFEGNTLFTEEQLMTLVTVKKGSTFSPQKLRDAAQKITTLYGSHGYIDAFVSFNPHLDLSGPEYDVDFVVEEGAEYRVGMINVYGNTCTTSRVILHESLLTPGEVFDITKLRQTEQRLMAIGYFESVNVYAVRPSDGEEGGFRDVNIEVEETGTGSFSAFFGFSTMEAIFGGINLTERNFNLRGIFDVPSYGLTALRGGGEYAHITATIGQHHNSYVFSWAKPYFCDSQWTVGFEAESSSNRISSRGYDIEALGLYVYARYPLNQFLQFGTHYRFRHSDATVPADADERLRRQEQNSGIISGVGTSLVYDSTNDVNNPSCGFRSRLDLEYVGLGGNHTFASLSYINTYYLPLFCDGILKLRADARFILPTSDTTLDTLPLDERYYLGGETSVRGYRPYAIGPKYANGTDARGGISQTLLSMEYMYHMFSKADIFTFVDIGDVSADHFNIDTPRASWGYGVRLSVLPQGPPVTIGMGYPINSASESDEKRFFLSLGGKF